MSESLSECLEGLAGCVETLRAAVDGGDAETARDAARAVLSWGSKLHTRLGILVEFRRDAGMAAEVDRALVRARQLKPEIPGQSSIADAVPPAPPKRRGKGKA